MSDPIQSLSKAMRRKGIIVWIDMEMTGLDPERDRIIEMATIVTDGELNILEEGPEFVIKQPNIILDDMDEWNTHHHGKSGLTARVRQSKTTEQMAEEATLEFLRQFCDEKSAPLAGNSIHQDRRFIARYMKNLDSFLHYRMIDVSTVKELGTRWFPDVIQRCPKKANNHRALDDIRESISELRYYRRNMFRSF